MPVGGSSHSCYDRAGLIVFGFFAVLGGGYLAVGVVVSVVELVRKLL